MPDLIESTPTADPHADTSFADHEQSFHAPSRSGESRPSAPAATDDRADDGLEPEPAGDKGKRDETGRFKPAKQRAQSQRASKDDVAQISAYTRRIREAEERLGITVERQPGESERVYNLRRRAELIEAKAEALKTAPKAPELPAKPLPKAPEPFTEREPQYEDFANEPDQYQAHMRALAAYDRRKEAHEQAAKGYTTAQQEAISERNARRDAWFKEQETAHLTRMEQYHQAHPEAQAIIDAAGDVSLTPAMYAAVMTAENSPELLILVAKDADLRDDLTILTEGKPLNKDLVALVQRRLNRGLTAGTTGAAPLPAQPIPAVPRPPTPVRTGPMKTGNDMPSDDAPLSAHEKAFHKQRR